MRRPLLLMLFAATMLPVAAFSQQLTPSVKKLLVHAHADVGDLACEKKTPTLRPPTAPNLDPMEVPSDEMVELMGAPQASAVQPNGTAAPLSPLRLTPSKGVYRIAVWGDSHLAAGFFTEELVKQLKLTSDAVPNAIIPANMGRAGVRLPIRRSCVSAQWRYEPGYLGGESAAAPGPGLVNMFSDQAGATLAWDLRKDAQSPGYERVRILYQQTETPMVIGLAVDGEAEKEVTLDEKAGPAVLELMAEQPVSQVRIRLIDARFRFHGLELLSRQPNPFQLDVFGYPGATVAAWKAANLDYLGAWFSQPAYQLVLLEFGTNEGNVKPFDLASYRKTLSESVRNMRTVFPAAACILIAPGDRGILVRRSANIRHKAAPAGARHKTAASKKQAAQAKRNSKAKADPAIDLLVYSRIHADIGRVQAEVAEAAGCSAWSMMHAMGGPGHSYQWAHQSPALMSTDLIHFTVAGYQRLAQKFVRDMGWTGAINNNDAGVDKLGGR
ncbi:MAG: hypothetical protein ABIT83_19835 [Massilia sp.]